MFGMALLEREITRLQCEIAKLRAERNSLKEQIKFLGKEREVLSCKADCQNYKPINKCCAISCPLTAKPTIAMCSACDLPYHGKLR